MNVRAIVIGTHEYQWVTNIMAFLFEKYVGLPLLYVGDRIEGPLYEGLEFMQVPCFTEGIWPWDHHFARGLCSIFESFKDDLILLLLPDHWITARVDVSVLEAMARFMETHEEVVRGCVTEGQALYGQGHIVHFWEDFEIWGVSPGNQHASLDGGITFCPAIWNPMVRRLFDPQWTLQECENLGTKRMATEKTGMISVGIHPAPIRRTHALYHSRPRVVSLEGVSVEDKEKIKAHMPDYWKVLE